MPRLQNTANGAVVNVSDEKATRMGHNWVPYPVEVKRGPGRPKKTEAPSK